MSKVTVMRARAKVAKKGTPPKGGAVVVHHPSAPQSLLQVVATASRDPKVDPAKMQAILTMAQREREAEGERVFNEALALAQSQVPKIVRNRMNPHTKSKYATLENVSRMLDPILRNHGFSLTYGLSDCPRGIDWHRITATLSKGGHSRQYFVDLPADIAGAKGTANKTAVQGIGSTISYGRRYLKLMIFDILIEGEDDDGSGGNRSISKAQAKTLRDELKSGGPKEDKFCGAFSIDTVEDLPAERYQEAMDRIAQYKEGNKPAAEKA